MKKLLAALGLLIAFSAPTFANTNDGDRQIPGPIKGGKTYPYKIEVWRNIKGHNGSPDQLQFISSESGSATMSVINARVSALMRIYPYPNYQVFNAMPLPYEPEDPIIIAPWNPEGPIRWIPITPEDSLPWNPDRPLKQM